MNNKIINNKKALLVFASFLAAAIFIGCHGNNHADAKHNHGAENDTGAVQSPDQHSDYSQDADAAGANAPHTHSEPDQTADSHSQAANPSGQAGESGGLQLTPEQKQRINLQLARVSKASIHKRISFPGEIRLDQDSFIRLIPRVSGVVTEVRVTKGDSISEGQVLAVLESPEIGRVKAAFLEACRESHFQKAELDRFVEIRKNSVLLIDLLASEPALTEINQDMFGDMADYGSRLISSYAGYSVSKKAFERRQVLFEKRISSEKDFLAARGAYAGSRAEYLSNLANIKYSLEQEELNRAKARQASGFSRKAAVRQLEIMGMTSEKILNLAASIDSPDSSENSGSLTSVHLRAPRNGTILERLAGVGERAEADTTLFTMADLDNVWACLKVPARDLAHVRTGQKVEITSESGKSAIGTVKVIGPLVSEDTRTADIRVIVSNGSGDWKPGLFIRGLIDLPASELRTIIPKTALQNIDGEDLVFLPRGNSFITAPVKTGLSDSTSIEILSGLEPGMEYVEKGAFELKAIIITGALDPHAGHGH